MSIPYTTPTGNGLLVGTGGTAFAKGKGPTGKRHLSRTMMTVIHFSVIATDAR
jgi:hypothetical protein